MLNEGYWSSGGKIHVELVGLAAAHSSKRRTLGDGFNGLAAEDQLDGTVSVLDAVRSGMAQTKPEICPVWAAML